jgi:hypothetical protein
MRLLLMIAAIALLFWILSHAYIFAPVGPILTVVFAVIIVCVLLRRR